MRLVRGLAPVSALLLLLAAAGCVSSPRPAARTEAPPPPRPEAPVQPEPPPAEAEAVEEEPPGAYGPKTIVIDQPEAEPDETRTLAEAAREAKESRAAEGPPIAVITDETLPEYATGELSIAAEKPAAAGAGDRAREPDAARADEAAGEPARGEAYWRDRVRAARLRWRDLLEEITRLESQVAELRQRFYAEDDGFYRDSQIKPAWDRALDRLAETEDEVRRARENLRTILHEGRLAGALPGWLREGIELEPVVEEPEEEPGIHEVTEPKVIDEDGGSDRP